MEQKIQLLYAEDDPEWAFSIKMLLEGNDFMVDIASDGDIAWEKFKKDHPDMVLLDIDMPGKNGWELICELKRINEWTPVVLYSSFFDSKKLEDAFGLGAEDFISKSCLPGELADRLKALYTRAIKLRYNTEIFKISPLTTFHATSGILVIGKHKEVLKLNETKLMAMLCHYQNENVSNMDLCESIWGKGMSNEGKLNALKNLVTNLRKILSADPSLQIINKRWIGYCLVCQ